MGKLFLGTALAAVLSTAAYAQEAAAPAMTSGITGSIEMEFAETAAGDIGATTTLGLGVEAQGIAFGSIDLETENGSALAVDGWALGTVVGPAAISVGDQGGVFVEGENGATLADPAMGESVNVSLGGIGLAVGFNDLSADVTDLSNLQGAYTADMGRFALTAAGDYNLDSEDWALGGRVEGLEVAGVGLGSTLTYGSATEAIGYEVDGSIMGVTAYLNGDDSDMLQNVGAGYTRDLGGLSVGTDVNYNIDTEEFAPSVTVGFTF